MRRRDPQFPEKLCRLPVTPAEPRPTPSPSLRKGPGPARKGLPGHLRAHCGKRLQTEAGLNSSPQSHGALLIKAAAQLSADEGWPWTVRAAGICLVSGPVSWSCLCRPGGQRRPRRPHREGRPSLGARLSPLNPGDNEDLAQFLGLQPVGGPREPLERPDAGHPEALLGKVALRDRLGESTGLR